MRSAGDSYSNLCVMVAGWHAHCFEWACRQASAGSTKRMLIARVRLEIGKSWPPQVGCECTGLDLVKYGRLLGNPR